MNNDSWYAVTLIFVSEIDGSPTLRPLCEERVVLVRSGSEKAARSAASRYAREDQIAYDNDRGEEVSWKFLGIEKVEDLPAPPATGVWEVAWKITRYSHRTLEKLLEP